MINIQLLMQAIDFEPNSDDENNLHKYLNREINGIEYEDSFRIPKYFRWLLIQIKSILD